jgi:hypothetical protein
MKRITQTLLLATLAVQLWAATGDGPTLLPQINATQDDGSAEGVQKSKLIRGDLAKLPFINGRFTVDNISGSATANHFAAAGQGNPDGSGGVLVVTAPNNSGIRVIQTFHGTVFGLRWVRGTSDFAVTIDGMAYRVVSKLNEPESTTAVGLVQYENLTVIADDLPDGPHVAELVFVNATGSSITWNLYGYLVEQRAGHGGTPRVAGVINATTVPATDTAVIDNSLRSIRKIKYYNTDTVARKVTIKQNNKIIGVVYLAAAGTAPAGTANGDSGEYDFGEFTALATTASGTGQFSHAADAATVVNFMPIGGL